MARIALDLDNVVSATVADFTDYVNRKYGTSHNPETFTDYSFWRQMGLTDAEFQRELAAYWQSEDFHRMRRPVPGAVEVVNTLSSQHELAIITATSLEIERQTKEFLERYFPDKISEVTFSSGWINSHRKTKAEICKEKGYQYLVEDGHHYAIECAKAGVRVILLDYPWNRHELPPEVIRAKSWKDIPNILNSEWAQL